MRVITSKRIKTFLHLNLGYKLLLMEAFLSLGISRLALLTMEFKEIAPYLGKQREPESVFAGKKRQPPTRAKKVGRAVRLMSNYTPWESKCLAQAMAAKIMLNRRGIKSELYLGVAKDERGRMIAHAWVKCCGFVLTGAEGMDGFTVVSVFSG